MMIVKKIPILQGFPTLETVKYLSNTKNELSEYNPIFYDIETTGLSRYTAFVYLIGAVRFEENQWMLYQWMGRFRLPARRRLRQRTGGLLPAGAGRMCQPCL